MTALFIAELTADDSVLNTININHRKIKFSVSKRRRKEGERERRGYRVRALSINIVSH